jgi:hypothetical protein
VIVHGVTNWQVQRHSGEPGKGFETVESPKTERRARNRYFAIALRIRREQRGMCRLISPEGDVVEFERVGGLGG